MIPLTTTSRQPIREAWTDERLFRERAIALGFAIESSTAAAYDSHLNSYITFCQLHHRQIDPTPDTLSYYVVWLSHHLEPRSVDNYLSGIANRLEFMYPDVRAVRRCPLVTRTLRGCKRRLSKPVRQKSPLGLDDLARITHIIRKDANAPYDDTLFLAMLITGFKSLQRLGELTWPDSTKLQSYKKVSLRHTLSYTNNSVSYTLPYQKNDSLGTGFKILITAEPNSAIDPLAHMCRYLDARDALFLHHPALWVTETGNVPTRSWFLRRLHRFCGAEVSGHSMRAGGATALAAEGMAPDLIRASGRWSSDEFNKYIRQHPVILHALMHGTARAP